MRYPSTFFLVAAAIALGGTRIPGQSGPSAEVEFSTYFGGSGLETVKVVRVDSDRNVYLAGATSSTDFPTRRNLFPPPSSSAAVVGFLTKLRADGSIVYSTYLARSVVALAVDRQGNAIVADNLPAGNRFSGPLDDIVITKIDAIGAEVLFSVRLAGSNFERVASIAVDHTGAVVITGQTNSPDFPLVRPLQPPVRTSSDTGAFITKLDALGRIVFSTGWGGSGADAGTAIDVDRALDIYVAGTTSSADFATTPGALQRTLANSTCDRASVLPCTDAFVTKFGPEGQTIVYSTLFGGTNNETVAALAVDHLGNAHLAGTTASTDLPLRRAVQSSCDDTRHIHGCSAYIAKLNANGSALDYATLFGSRSYYVFGLGQIVTSLSVDRDGNLIVVGATQGNDLPLVRAVQTVNGGGPLFKSTDNGVSWTSSSSGITGSGVWFIASGDRRQPRLYATNGQLFRSDDQGRTWRARPTGVGSFDSIARVIVDPLTPSTLYALDALNGCLKSTDAGDTWSRLSINCQNIADIVVAPSSPSNIYVSTLRGVFHSPNGGITWSLVLDTNPNENYTKPWPVLLAVDPRNADVVYVGFSDRTILRKDTGQLWSPVAPVACPVNQLVFTSDSPPTMYALACGKIWKSIDAARTWRDLSVASGYGARIALDPTLPNVVYSAASVTGIYRSTDRGETWSMLSDGFDHDFRSILVDPVTPGTIYAGATSGGNAFVARLDPAGAITLSSYLGGLSSGGTGAAVEWSGTIIVAGTAGRGFPLVRPLQSTYGGGGDAFLTRIAVRP